PANAEVNDFLARVYTELAHKYELDGIGLDYMRYPILTALNYDQNNRQRILDRYRVDIDSGADIWKDPEKAAKLREYRMAAIEDAMRSLRATIKSVRPNISVIACLISDPKEAKEDGQDWAVSSNLLDYASPM